MGVQGNADTICVVTSRALALACAPRRGVAASSTMAAAPAVGAGVGADGVAEKELGDPVVELFGLVKSYKLEGGEEVPALRDLSLHSTTEFPSVRRGEFVMIRGPSGGGKTTLLNVIGTIDTPSKGSLRLFGEMVDFSTASDTFLADLRLRRIGFVFQVGASGVRGRGGCIKCIRPTTQADVQSAGNAVGVRERGAAHVHLGEAERGGAESTRTAAPATRGLGRPHEPPSLRTVSAWSGGCEKSTHRALCLAFHAGLAASSSESPLVREECAAWVLRVRRMMRRMTCSPFRVQLGRSRMSLTYCCWMNPRVRCVD